jgi:enamine deaminase RidA (YjgF/YER057c/UK114 family)
MPVLRHLVPQNIRAPFARYSHAVEITGVARWLVCSGQLGVSVGDEIPESAEAQAVLCFEAIAECLAEADMSFADVVRINAYVTDREYMKPYMTVRDRYIGSPEPASTLMIVSGFARPEFKIEVEVIAAKAAD